MNSQISQISEIIEDIKEKISDNEYKIIMDNLMKVHNNNELKEDDYQQYEEELTEDQMEILKLARLGAAEIKRQQREEQIIRKIMHMAEEQTNHLKNVRLRIEELNQQTHRIINQ